MPEICDTPISVPIAVTVLQASRLTGISRTELYRRLADGDLTARKLGRKTVIEYSQLTDYIASLPAAEFHAAQ